jgi:hypothetical protein
MKSYIIGILICCGIIGTVVAWASQGTDTTTASQIQALKKQVNALEQRVEALEEQTLLRQPPRSVPLPAPRLPGRRVPDNWRQREFNGIPYYIVPLHRDANSVPAPTK